MLGRVVVPFLAKVEVVGRENAELVSKPLIIIANHKSYYDPLLIAVSLKIFSKVYPLMFIAKDQLFINPFSRFIFRSMGSFPVLYGAGRERSLETPVSILNNGGSVVFFPEARCIREERLGECKTGVTELALKVPEVCILPIAIRNSYKIKDIFSRPRVGIAIGKPFRFMDIIDEEKNPSPERVTEKLMNEIATLYSRLS